MFSIIFPAFLPGAAGPTHAKKNDKWKKDGLGDACATQVEASKAPARVKDYLCNASLLRVPENCISYLLCSLCGRGVKCALLLLSPPLHDFSNSNSNTFALLTNMQSTHRSKGNMIILIVEPSTGGSPRFIA